jgi:MFS transporter, FSR family, fosmidomycin resistance protein
MTTATLASPIPVNPAAVPLHQDAKVISLVGLAHASSHFSHMLLPPMFPVLMQEFGLNFSQVGWLMAVFFIVSGVGQALSGFVVDRLGARPVLFVAIAVFVAAALTASVATSYAGLVMAAALAGLGNSPFHPVDFTIMNQRVSAPRLSHAFSAHGITGSLGWAIAPVFMVGITALSGWRAAYMCAALMYVCILVLLFVLRAHLHTDTVVRHANAKAGDDFAFMKLPAVWWCFGFFFLSATTLSIVQSYSVSILKALHGVSFEAATATLTAYMLCNALGTLAGGFVAARTKSSDVVVAVCMACAAFLFALCATGVLGAAGSMVALALTGFSVGIGGPSRDMLIKKATPKGATGRVYGMVYSGLDVGFALSPVVFGAFMDRGWYAASLYGGASMLLLAVGVALGVGRRTHRAA